MRTLEAKLHQMKGEELIPITIRLEPQLLKFLDRIEAITGIRYYQYIRALVQALETEFKQGQKIELPFRIVSCAYKKPISTGYRRKAARRRYRPAP